MSDFDDFESFETISSDEVIPEDYDTYKDFCDSLGGNEFYDDIKHDLLQTYYDDDEVDIPI